MKKYIEDEVDYYYDSHPTNKDQMGETAWHAILVRYLVLVLQWRFQDQVCGVYDNLNFYQTGNFMEHPLAPDVAVIKGVPYPMVSSWKVGLTGPVPQVVFEIASKETWRKDVFEKPDLYAKMGVKEYFAYDPNRRPLWGNTTHRLRGWRFEEGKSLSGELELDEQGRLWSEELDSWLVPDGTSLRLYDRDNQLRLTEAEAKDRMLKIKTREAQANKRQAETNKRQAELKTREAEANKRQAEASKRQAEAFAEKLRTLGIDPDKI